MQKRINCAVLSCNEKLDRLHHFPKCPMRLKTWIELVGNEELLKRPPAYITNNFRICSKHFPFINERICRDFVPSFFLPDPIDASAWAEKYIKNAGAEQNLPIKFEPCMDMYDTQPSTSAIEFHPLPSSRRDTSQFTQPTTSVIEFHPLPSSIGTGITIKQLKKRIRQLHIKDATPQDRIRSFKLFQRKVFNLKQHPELETFISQLVYHMNCGNKKGRRYSIRAKIFSLSWYLRSRSLYKITRQHFPLPSPTVLKNLLSSVKILPGTFEVGFKMLEMRMQKIAPKKRLAVLMFDDMSIRPHFHYDARRDIVYGFAEDGFGREKVIANRAQVFMLVGIFGRWKQVIAFNFCRSANKPANTVRYVKLLVNRCREIGLNIISTVCDQGPSNIRAIKQLKSESADNNSAVENGTIIIGNNEIVPLFDPPHLFMSMRDNLLTKKLVYKNKCGQYETCDWTNIIDAYERDLTYPERLKLLPKITPNHLYAKKIKKKKVSLCTQIFSVTMAKVIYYCVAHKAKRNDGREFEQTGMGTVNFLTFMNDLFDSVNAHNTAECTPHTNLKKAVSNNSEHLQLWQEALEMFASMEFIPSKESDLRRPQILRHFSDTLKGLICLRNKILSGSAKRFFTKCFNQDPLEILFRQIRQHGNGSPTAKSFENHLKNIVLNNHNIKFRKKENCEDLFSGIINGIADLLDLQDHKYSISQVYDDALSYHHGRISSHDKDKAFDSICSYLNRTLPVDTINCSVCKPNIFETDSNDDANGRIYSGKLILVLTVIYNQCHKHFPHIIHNRNIVKTLVKFLNDSISLSSVFACGYHINKQNLISDFVRHLLLAYIKNVNEILRGKVDSLYKPLDLFESAARKYYLKYNK